MIVEALIGVCVVGALFIVFLRGRNKRKSQDESAASASPNRFDTTLGEFHDMREALRPLQHTRAASRKIPNNREQDRPLN